MFGGEARVPESVKKAMLLCDYGDGKLTAKNIIKEFFNEIPDKGDYDYKTINGYFDGLFRNLDAAEGEWEQFEDVAPRVKLAMENSGLTFAEVVPMIRSGNMAQPPKYLSTGSMPLSKFDGREVRGSADVIAAFKERVQSPAMRRGLSSVLQQISHQALAVSLGKRAQLPPANGHPSVETSTLPGIDKILSRDSDKVEYAIDLMIQSQNPVYDLEMRDDGTATLTFTYSSNFGMGVDPNLTAVFGRGTMKCALTLDLNGDRPVVTDAKLAQSFEA